VKRTSVGRNGSVLTVQQNSMLEFTYTNLSPNMSLLL